MPRHYIFAAIVLVVAMALSVGTVSAAEQCLPVYRQVVTLERGYSIYGVGGWYPTIESAIQAGGAYLGICAHPLSSQPMVATPLPLPPGPYYGAAVPEPPISFEMVRFLHPGAAALVVTSEPTQAWVSCGQLGGGPRTWIIYASGCPPVDIVFWRPGGQVVTWLRIVAMP